MAAYGYIYFIQSGEDGPIKVGFAKSVRPRLVTLQMGNPVKLRLLHQEMGSMADEARWHERLLRFRVRGEWFRPNAIIDKHIAKKAAALAAVQAPKVRDLDYARMIRERREKNEGGRLKALLRKRGMAVG